MFFDEEEESSGYQHSTSKPKEKKNKKKQDVIIKEFLSLQDKVDQILVAIKYSQPQSEDLPGPKSLIDRIEILEARKRLAAECIFL